MQTDMVLRRRSVTWYSGVGLACRSLLLVFCFPIWEEREFVFYFSIVKHFGILAL